MSQPNKADLGPGGDPYVFLQILASWVKIRLHNENWLPMLNGSALKISEVVSQLELKLSWAATI